MPNYHINIASKAHEEHIADVKVSDRNMLPLVLRKIRQAFPKEEGFNLSIWMRSEFSQKLAEDNFKS